MTNSEDDRIERDAAAIQKDAADIEAQRATEIADSSQEAQIDAEIAALAERRSVVDGERIAAHEKELAEDADIGEKQEDLRDALGKGAPPSSGSSPPSGGSAPGPCSPPIVPPRRVA